MKAELMMRRATVAALPLVFGACAWFTDFKQQPSVGTWQEFSSDSGELKGFLEERLLASGARVHQVVRQAELERLFDRHHAGLQDYGLQFWALWMLELWLCREADATVNPAPSGRN